MERRVQDMMDFDARTECLVLVWDDGAGPEPDARLAPCPDDPALWEALLDGVVMARVPVASGLTRAHVAVMPLSAARAVGWVGAGPENPFAHPAQSAYTPASAPPHGAGGPSKGLRWTTSRPAPST